MFVYSFKYLTSIDNEQQRRKARPLRYATFQIKLHFESVPSIESCWVLPLKYNAIQDSAVSRTPNADLSLSGKIPWSVVSKAALKSNRTSKVTCWSFMFRKMSFFTFKRADSVLWNLRHDDCNMGNKLFALMWCRSCLATALSASLEMNYKFLKGR